MARSTAALIMVFALTINAAAVAQNDSAFSFQGELTDGGAPANGSYNMDFSLWDAGSGGNLIGSILMIDDVAVSEGRFTVELDFGVAAFDNSSRWLEVGVNGQPLSPRQAITRTPYAMQTRGMFVDDNQRVGIGTTNPKGMLHVADDYYGRGHVYLHAFEGDGADGTAYLQARDDSGTSSINLRLRTQLAGQVMNTMTLSSIGRVGIGTTAPLAALHVSNPIPLIYLQDLDSTGNQQTGYISLRDSAGSEKGWMGYGSQVDSKLTVANHVGDVVLFSNGRRAVLTTEGRFGIGTSLPAYTLHVESNEDRVVFARNTSVGISFGVVGEATALNGVGVFGRVPHPVGPNVGVWGESAGALGYNVFGEATATSGTNYGVSGLGRSTDGFDFFAQGAGVDYGSSSSIRWKRNIERIHDSLYKLSKLRGVYFDWDEEHGGHRDVGFIAEEIGAVLPEIVNYEKNGIDAHGMDYSRMSALVVEAVNDLHAKVVSENAILQAENDDLRERVVALEALLNQIISRIEEKPE